MFFVEVFDKIKDYNINQILDSSSNLYVDLFPITQSDKFKNKYSYIYRKLTYILEDYSNIDSLVSFCIESNIHSSMRSFALNLIKKVILFDYKFNIDSVDLNYLVYNYILLQIKNTNQVKFNYLKNEFFINLCYFIINEKTQHVDKNVLKISNLEEDILKDIKECINFNILVDIVCNYLNKKFNLNLESEFYRLLKN